MWKCSLAGQVLSYIQRTEQLNKRTENNGSRFLSEGEEGTNIEMRKVEINPVVIDSDWSSWYKLIVFKIDNR